MIQNMALMIARMKGIKEKILLTPSAAAKEMTPEAMQAPTNKA